MTIDEAIKHAEEAADYDCYNEKQIKCAEEHRQLAEWLKELKRLKEQTEWIPVSDIRKLEGILLMKINSFEGTRNIVEKGMLEVWKEVVEYIDGMLGEDGEECTNTTR